MAKEIHIETIAHPCGDNLKGIGWAKHKNQLREFYDECKFFEGHPRASHTIIWFDKNGDLHGNWGPAFIHSNGWVVWYLHGDEVPFEEWYENTPHVQHLGSGYFGDLYLPKDVRYAVNFVKAGLENSFDEDEAA